jgi:hypothetical protein
MSDDLFLLWGISYRLVLELVLCGCPRNGDIVALVDSVPLVEELLVFDAIINIIRFKRISKVINSNIQTCGRAN